MEKFSDEQLVAQYLKQNKEEALECLIKRYLSLIYSISRKYTGDKDNASDITQEVFVKVWQNLSKFDQSKSFRNWIFAIAKNTALDWLKKKSALPFSTLESSQEDYNFSENLADETVSMADQLDLKETSKKLTFVLSQIPASYNSVIKLHVNDGLKFREIAESLKEPINTVKSRYRRGLALLKILL